MDQQLIRLINRLQDAFSSVGLTNNVDLPQIAVVGSQSSGKSSVLENIVGRDFLPRGSGIVTRRPLVLQLINRPRSAPTPPSSSADVSTNANANANAAPSPSADSASNVVTPDEWGEFLHLPGKKFHDFHEIRKEIVRDTEEKTGSNLGISDLPINLRIFSPHVLTLTLVDLPGITKVPVGNQPPDIEIQIRKMILRYITRPHAIILAVSAANSDLANSDALKLAREVDPDGMRTIGVLTKIDLMDQGTDVINILAGKVIQLRLGYVPVVNRGQREIDRNTPISRAIEAERAFFEGHDAYRSKAKYCGTPYLSCKLNAILLHHIKETLPEIKNRITKQLTQTRVELAQMGDSPFDAKTENSNFILSVITEFCNDFCGMLDGRSHEISSAELVGGARISFLFHDTFRAHIDSIDPFDHVKDADIRTIVYNASGSQPALFWGTNAFEIIVRQQIRRLEEPALRCVQLVYEELSRILATLLTRPAFVRFPDLRDKVSSVVLAFLRAATGPTNKLVSDIVAAEISYINTCHPDFISGHKATAIVTEKLAPPPPPPPAPPQAAGAGAAAGQLQQHQQGLGNRPQSILGLDNRPSVPPRAGQPLPQSQMQAYPSSTIMGNSAAPDYSPSANGGSGGSGSGGGDGGFFDMFSRRGTNAGKRSATLETPPQVLRPEGRMTDRERIEIEVVKLLLSSYFNIVKRTIKDLCPKSIMLNLVHYSRENLQKTLLAELYSRDVLDRVLTEADHVVSRRRELRNLLKALESADEIVKSVN